MNAPFLNQATVRHTNTAQPCTYIIQPLRLHLSLRAVVVNPCTPVVTLSGSAEWWWGQKSWQVMDRVPQWHMRPSPTPSCPSRLLPCAWYASRCLCTALWPRWVHHWKCCPTPIRSSDSYSSHFFPLWNGKSVLGLLALSAFVPSPLSPDMLRVPSMSVRSGPSLLWRQHWTLAHIFLSVPSFLSLVSVWNKD